MIKDTINFTSPGYGGHSPPPPLVMMCNEKGQDCGLAFWGGDFNKKVISY